MRPHADGRLVGPNGPLWLVVAALLLVACGAGAGNSAAEPSATPPAVGWEGEVDDAPYVAYERVSYERLPTDRLEPAGEIRLPRQVRRLSALRRKRKEERR